MKRTLEVAIAALDQLVRGWAVVGAKPGIRIFVYPPEWEARMLVKLQDFAESSRSAGYPVELIDIGALFVHRLETDVGLVDMLTATEKESGTELALRDLGTIASQCISSLLQAPLDPPAVCRLLVNTATLATFVSYSAIANQLHDAVADPAVLAFPGESDEGSLNLLHLRGDTNYRTPRV
jgi:hypothetical protein